MSGEADTQEVSVTGSGTFDGQDFEGKYVEVSTKGGRSATVWATVDLDVSLAGEGDIRYYGDVVPDMSTGSGTVISLGGRRSLHYSERRVSSQEEWEGKAQDLCVGLIQLPNKHEGE